MSPPCFNGPITVRLLILSLFPSHRYLYIRVSISLYLFFGINVCCATYVNMGRRRLLIICILPNIVNFRLFHCSINTFPFEILLSILSLVHFSLSCPKYIPNDFIGCLGQEIPPGRSLHVLSLPSHSPSVFSLFRVNPECLPNSSIILMAISICFFELTKMVVSSASWAICMDAFLLAVLICIPGIALQSFYI